MLDAPLVSSGDSDWAEKPRFSGNRGERYWRGVCSTVLNAGSLERHPVNRPSFKLSLDDVFVPFHVVEKACDETVNFRVRQAHIFSVVKYPRL